MIICTVLLSFFANSVHQIPLIISETLNIISACIFTYLTVLYPVLFPDWICFLPLIQNGSFDRTLACFQILKSYRPLLFQKLVQYLSFSRNIWEALLSISSPASLTNTMFLYTLELQFMTLVKSDDLNRNFTLCPTFLCPGVFCCT